MPHVSQTPFACCLAMVWRLCPTVVAVTTCDGYSGAPPPLPPCNTEMTMMKCGRPSLANLHHF